MSKPIIAIDIDDVLADYAAGFVQFSNERWGTNLTVDDYDEHWGQVWKVEHDEVARRAGEMHGSSFVSHLKHRDGALPVLEELSKRFKLIVITSRRTQTKDDTIAWLRVHYPMISSDNVTFAGIWDTIDDTSIHKTKGDIAKSLSVSYLIDDLPKHCFAAAEHGIDALLFGDYTWNQVDALPSRVSRVSDWAGVLEYFNARQ